MQKQFIPLGLILATTIGSGVVLSSSSTSADEATASVDTISVTVSESCTLSSTGNNSHSTEMSNGQYLTDIGTTTMTAFCNDAGGFSIYAIGYTGDTLGSNVLTNASLGSTHDIATGTNTGPVGNVDNSAWAMKLGTLTTNHPAIIVGTNDDTEKDSETLDFSSYQAVPDTYTKVAYRTSSTDIASENITAEGSKLTTTYASYISKTQPAGTYTGQVKYTMVHPYTEPAPTQGVNCNPEGTTIDSIICMQDISTTNKSSVLSSMIEDGQYQLLDSRDGKEYYVSKLKDGNIWMTQNLDHDIDANRTYTPADTDIPEDWTPWMSTRVTSDTSWPGEMYDAENGEWKSFTNWSQSYDPGDKIWDGEISGSGTITIDNMDQGSNLHYHIGNYYNWVAATAQNENEVKDVYYEDFNQSICPAGWRLPSEPENGSPASKGSFIYLLEQYGFENNGDSLSNNEMLLYQEPFYLTHSGYYSSSSSYNTGYEGYYWTSRRYENVLSRNIMVNPDGYSAHVTIRYDNAVGQSVRCLTR